MKLYRYLNEIPSVWTQESTVIPSLLQRETYLAKSYVQQRERERSKRKELLLRPVKASGPARTPPPPNSRKLPPPPPPPSLPLTLDSLARSLDPTSEFFEGTIASFRIWHNVAMTEEQISDLPCVQP